MNDELDRGLRAGFEDAKRAREMVKLVKHHSSTKPEELAVKVAGFIPYWMQAWREDAAEEWGVDIADLDGLRDADLDPRDLSTALSLIGKVNLYHSFGELLNRLDGYATDPGLSEGEIIARVCETGLEAVEVFEASKLHTLREIRRWAERGGSEKEVREAKDAEARYLAGHLATRISMERNRRLARALDDIREGKKLARTDRFETLLRELYVLAPGVWDEHHRTDWRLRATRSAVVKKIERRLLVQPGESSAQEIELTAFANREREAALKRGREAGLTPREYELFKLFVERPDTKYREAARTLGISVGTVGALKARIKKVLYAS